jgi:hypothetical protein
MARFLRIKALKYLLLVCSIACLAGISFAGNDILGEVHLKGATKVEKDSGVWVDGQYLGYL